MESQRRKSAFNSMSHLTHTCFKCSARFANSGQLVQHMKEHHTSFVERPTSSNLPRPSDLVNRDIPSSKNPVATCPFCSHDCMTRKKLMLHLELEHKDDNEAEEEPPIKFIRLDDSKKKLIEELRQQNHDRSSPAPSTSAETNVVRNLLQSIGPHNNNNNGAFPSTSLAKADAKPATNKLQYKCFWCDASFRKRGKLMDHIDTLHKHNKQQNQVEAEMLSLDDPTRQLNKLPPQIPFSSNNLFRPSVPGYYSSPAPSLSNMAGHHGFISQVNHHRADIPVTETKNKQSSNLCSFNLLGPLKPTDRPRRAEPQPSNTCKFYMGKKGNPLANSRPAAQLSAELKAAMNAQSSASTNCNARRYSLPNMLDGMVNGGALSNFAYPFRLMSPASTMAAAMQQSYLFGMRPPFFPQSFYPPPRMPMMLPPHTSALMDRSQTPPQQQNGGGAHFFNRTATTCHNMTPPSPRLPLAPVSPATTVSSHTGHTDSPLDLTKSYL